jgi:hypothetical protein
MPPHFRLILKAAGRKEFRLLRTDKPQVAAKRPEPPETRSHCRVDADAAAPPRGLARRLRRRAVAQGDTPASRQRSCVGALARGPLAAEWDDEEQPTATGARRRRTIAEHGYGQSVRASLLPLRRSRSVEGPNRVPADACSASKAGADLISLQREARVHTRRVATRTRGASDTPTPRRSR